MIHRVAPEARGAPFAKHLAAFMGAAAIAAVAAYPFGVSALATELVPWTEGPQPLFALPSIDGPNVALAAQNGGAVLVHFFATWCEPCREELPALKRLSERGGPSVKILAISVAEVDVRVQRFVQSAPVNFPILLDRDRALTKAWKVSTLPTTFVLDAQLKPRLMVQGDYAWDMIDPKKLFDGLPARGGRDRPRQQDALTQNREGKNNVPR